jgi:CheY-like chemotaxis protein
MTNVKSSLLIDDDLDDQEIFIMCVKSIGRNIDCSTASNGADAIAMLESTKEYIPHYIFLDVNMPKMNGIECLKLLKQIDRLKDTKIFMYSTTSETSVVEKCKDLGADEFIIKPAKTIDLKKKLAEIFSLGSG